MGKSCVQRCGGRVAGTPVVESNRVVSCKPKGLGIRSEQKLSIERLLPSHSHHSAEDTRTMTAEGEITTSAGCVGPPPDSCFAQQNGGVPSPTTASAREPKRPVVAVDVDEVLGYFVSQLCAFHNKNYGTELTPEDFTSYYFHEVCPQDRFLWQHIFSVMGRQRQWSLPYYFIVGSNVPILSLENLLIKHF